VGKKTIIDMVENVENIDFKGDLSIDNKNYSLNYEIDSEIYKFNKKTDALILTNKQSDTKDKVITLKAKNAVYLDTSNIFKGDGSNYSPLIAISNMKTIGDVGDNGFVDTDLNLAIRYGTLSGSTDDNGFATINFETPFPLGCLAVVCVDSGSACLNYGVSGFNNTHFSVYVKKANGDVLANANFGCRYIAIGF